MILMTVKWLKKVKKKKTKLEKIKNLLDEEEEK